MNPLRSLRDFYKHRQTHRQLQTFGSDPAHWPTAQLSHLKNAVHIARTHAPMLQLLKQEQRLDNSLKQLPQAAVVPPVSAALKNRLLADATRISQRRAAALGANNRSLLFALKPSLIFWQNFRISLASMAVALVFCTGIFYTKIAISSSALPVMKNETALLSDISFLLSSADETIETELITLTINP